MDWEQVSDDPEWELHPVDLAGHALKNLAAEPVSCMSRKQLRQRARTWQQFRQPRSKQGETSLANLDMLCAADNKHKSDGPQLRQRPDGDIEIAWPNNEPS